jgi:hypothetical protein
LVVVVHGTIFVIIRTVLAYFLDWLDKGRLIRMILVGPDIILVVVKVKVVV